MFVYMSLILWKIILLSQSLPDSYFSADSIIPTEKKAF